MLVRGKTPRDYSTKPLWNHHRVDIYRVVKVEQSSKVSHLISISLSANDMFVMLEEFQLPIPYCPSGKIPGSLEMDPENIWLKKNM